MVLHYLRLFLFDPLDTAMAAARSNSHSAMEVEMFPVHS